MVNAGHAQVTVNGKDGKDTKATAKKSSKKTTLPNGVVVEDIKVGDGAQATAGKKVSMRYVASAGVLGIRR
jgi:FK506-binding nuclear protein